MIVLISGPSNGGKSTVSRALAEGLGWPHLEVDTIRHLIPSPGVRRANLHQQALVQDLTVRMAATYGEHGFDVIVDEGVHDPTSFAELRSRLRAVGKVVSIALICDFAQIIGARDKYAGSDYMPARLRPNYDAAVAAIAQGLFDLAIDNSAQTPEQTVAEVLAVVRARSPAGKVREPAP